MEMTDRQDDDMQADKHWTLEKKFSLPMVGGLLLQTGAILWFIATLNARVNTFEQTATDFKPQIEKIVRIETKVDDIKERISGIEQILRMSKPVQSK